MKATPSQPLQVESCSTSRTIARLGRAHQTRRPTDGTLAAEEGRSYRAPSMPKAPATVFITGASSGFGAAIAPRSHASGAQVVLAARRIDRLDALVRELGSRAHAVALDVRDRAAVLEA